MYLFFRKWLFCLQIQGVIRISVYLGRKEADVCLYGLRFHAKLNFPESLDSLLTLRLCAVEIFREEQNMCNRQRDTAG